MKITKEKQIELLGTGKFFEFLENLGISIHDNEKVNEIFDVSYSELEKWIDMHGWPPTIFLEKGTYDGDYFIKQPPYWLVYYQERGTVYEGDIKQFKVYEEAKRFAVEISISPVLLK